MPATQIAWTGLDMFLYLNTGTFASPVWTLVTNVIDLKRSKSRAEADLSSRADDEMQREPTIADFSISWGMISDETDTSFTTLRAAEEARTKIEIALANGLIATSGTVYVRREVKVFGFDEDQPLKDGVTTQLTVKPCKGARRSRVTVP